MTTYGRPILCFLALCLSLPALAADKAPDFVRVDNDSDNQPRALQLAIASYGPAANDRRLTVDLVSAIHIGDLSYYHELNERFTDYDVVLYEMVTRGKATPNASAKRSTNLLSATQVGMTKMLDLSYQLDGIEYDRANFVHADLNVDELFEQMRARDESLYVYFWRIYFKALDDYARDPLGLQDMELLAGLLSSGQDDAFKTVIAHQLADPAQMEDVLGEDADNAVIGARNQRAIDVLKREINGGAERIAIFYGAAHMPDLEMRLLEQLDLTYVETDWVDAWQLGL